MTQLALFRPGYARRPPAPEMAVHCLIADTLRLGLEPGWVWFHVPNEGARSKAEAGRLQRMGVMAGVSDFLLIGPPEARLHALELKRRGRKPSKAQEHFLAAVEAAGGHAAWVDTYEDALGVLRAWGAIRRVRA